jgi:hypothetical protein
MFSVALLFRSACCLGFWPWDRTSSGVLHVGVASCAISGAYCYAMGIISQEQVFFPEPSFRTGETRRSKRARTHRPDDDDLPRPARVPPALASRTRSFGPYISTTTRHTSLYYYIRPPPSAARTSFHCPFANPRPQRTPWTPSRAFSSHSALARARFRTRWYGGACTLWLMHLG